MIRELVHDPLFLSIASSAASAEDISIAGDLLETLKAHSERCVGMAANMIGESKRIIAFLDESEKAPRYTVMLNPEIIKKDMPYDTQEGCLSLLGEPRGCRRYRRIKVRYMDEAMKPRIKTYEGFTAQIIQHEVDHCDGVLI